MRCSPLSRLCALGGLQSRLILDISRSRSISGQWRRQEQEDGERVQQRRSPYERQALEAASQSRFAYFVYFLFFEFSWLFRFLLNTSPMSSAIFGIISLSYHPAHGPFGTYMLNHLSVLEVISFCLTYLHIRFLSMEMPIILT